MSPDQCNTICLSIFYCIAFRAVREGTNQARFGTMGWTKNAHGEYSRNVNGRIGGLVAWSGINSTWCILAGRLQNSGPSHLAGIGFVPL